MWLSRTTLMTQYWRSMDQLLAYSKSRAAEHLPAWQAFNRSIGTDGSVGIWHETYAVSPGSYESVYVNMPAFGLGRAGTLQPATGDRSSAAGRRRSSR
jgi:GH15 family glucan-1,4-alpha-glucosidase